MKCCLTAQSKKNNIEVPVPTSISTVKTSATTASITFLSSLSSSSDEATELDTEMSASNMSATTPRSSTGMKQAVVPACKLKLTMKRVFAILHFSSASRQTTTQAIAADIERNDGLNQLQAVYQWAVSMGLFYKNKTELATKASLKFKVTVAPRSLCRLIHKKESAVVSKKHEI